MARKNYRQLCGVAKALDVLGGRWTLLIVRDLLLGPRRFVDLQRGLVGIPANLLAERLRSLVDADVVTRQRLPAPASGVVYALTPEGLALEPVILGLGRFGQRWLATPQVDDRRDLRWLMLSLRRRYTGGAVPAGAVLTLGVVAPERAFSVEVTADRLLTRDGAPQRAELWLEGPEPLLAQTWLSGAVADGVAVRGDVHQLAAVLRCLGGPAKAP